MKEVKVAIIGFGTVGAGVAENILKNGEVIAKRTGVKLVLTRIADLDITTDRGVAVPKELLIDCMQEINRVTVQAPVHIGDVVLANILNTGVDIVATNNA